MKLLSTRKTLFIIILNAAICADLVAWGGSNYEEKQDVLHDLEVFAKVVEKIRSYYVDDVDTHELIREAIDKMLYDLDPHSQFLAGLEYEDLMVSTRGEYGGLGIFISFRDNYPTVISPIEGTPAEKVGLRGGDQIVEIEGQATEGWRTQKAVELLRGEPGSDVTFRVSRPGLTEPVEYTITREIINSVKDCFCCLLCGFGCRAFKCSHKPMIQKHIVLCIHGFRHTIRVETESFAFGERK